ncbi:MAG: outer membrane beta-barrel protein [Pseudomonadales bacterium]|nr:outer membrane beta-barrel protein [Pseudomonadales bacterium]
MCTRRFGRAGLTFAIVALIACGMIPQAALASWFIGGGIGESKVTDYRCTDCPPITSVDDTDTALALFSGYTFYSYFGAALEYVDLGELNARGPAPVTDRNEHSGWSILALTSYPIGERFEVYAKAGIFLWDQKVSYQDPGFGGDKSFDGTDATFGAGFGVYFGPRNAFGVQLEWRRFKDVGTNDPEFGHKSDIDLAMVNFVYRFPE